MIPASFKLPKGYKEIKVEPCPPLPKRDGASGRLMESLAMCGWFMPRILMRKNETLVWIGDPDPKNVREPDIIVPKRRYRRGIARIAKYIRGHHRYWALQARAAHRLATEEQ